jgi:CRISPR/Cas system CMR-associated protein Cmr3 (group 5 of RAMP superfamily)
MKISVLDATLKQFPNRDLSLARQVRKSLYLRKLVAEIDEGKRIQAIRSFGTYFLTSPERFKLPANRKRDIAKLILPKKCWPILAKA